MSYRLFSMADKLYSLRKSRKLLRLYFATFQRKRARLLPSHAEKFEFLLRTLDTAVLAGHREQASETAQLLEEWCCEHSLRGIKETSYEVIVAFVCAIAIAFIIRQFWFELYEVPTGSMRPTIQELDRLTVSKTTFGLHPPFRNQLFLYSPEFIQRAGIIVLTTAGLDLADSDMLYFGLIPGKKRYVKRCMCRPGDTLYFYGGYIYGIDQAGQPFTELCDPQQLEAMHLSHLDHVPYITMEGKTELHDRTLKGFYRASTLKQMNLPVAQLSVDRMGRIAGQFFDGERWRQDDPQALKHPHSHPVSYSDLWGIGNFAMVRLLEPQEAQHFYHIVPTPDALLYLELHHTPNTSTPAPSIRRGENGQTYPMLTPYTALLPVDRAHLEALQHALLTSRFCVRNEHAFSYRKGRGRSQPEQFDVALPHVPQGCYEFYHGVGYQVAIGGFRHKLPENHPLYAPTLMRSLFNCGVGWNRLFEPTAAYQPYHPHRYAYYRNGDLYFMGCPVFRHDDPLLQTFVFKELTKEQTSSPQNPYIAFVDRGPPLLSDGTLDIDKIRHFGLKIPEDALLALGDNYAMSADSRDFGFVPVNNLLGAPSFIFWPFSSRVGPLVQPPYPWCTLPNLLIWSLATAIIVGSWSLSRKRNRSPLFPK